MADRIRIGKMRGVARQGTATIDIPIRGYYNYFLMKIRGGGSANADIPLGTAGTDKIKELRIVINSQVIWRISGEMLEMINTYFGTGVNPNVIPLYFTRDWLRTAFGTNSSRLASFRAGVNGVITMEVEFDDDYFPRTVELFANHENQGRRGVAETGAYRGFTKITRNFASVGLEQIPSGEFATGAEILNALFIKSDLFNAHPSDAVLDEVKIYSNDTLIYHTDADTRFHDNKLLKRGTYLGMEVIEWSDKNLIGESFQPNTPNLSMELDWKTAPNAYEIFLDQTNTRAFGGARRVA